MHDSKTANLMKLLANMLENVSEEQLDDLVQASLSESAVAEKEPPAQPPSHEHVYDERWVVIQNQLLHAISRLSLNERRLIMHLSPIVRLAVNKNPKQRRFFVSALDFAKAFNIDPKNAYREVEKLATRMHEKPFYIWDFDKDGVHSKYKRGVSWFVECGYLEHKGGIEVLLGERVTEMLTVFDKNHTFTKHQKEWIVQLGGYGIALFQILWSYIYLKDIKDANGKPLVGMKEKEFTLKYLREKFDCVDKYDQLKDFKKYVLNAAIKDIHEHTPLKIKYDSVKTGRSTVGFKFTFWDTSEQKSIPNKDEDLSPMNTEEKDVVARATAHANAINATKIHRRNLINKALREHREQKNERLKKKKAAKKSAESKAISDQLQLEQLQLAYKKLCSSSDDEIKQFILAQQHLLTSGAEKHHFTRGEWRLCLSAMAYKFENPNLAKGLDLTVLK